MSFVWGDMTSEHHVLPKFSHRRLRAVLSERKRPSCQYLLFAEFVHNRSTEAGDEPNPRLSSAKGTRITAMKNGSIIFVSAVPAINLQRAYRSHRAWSAAAFQTSNRRAASLQTFQVKSNFLLSL